MANIINKFETKVSKKPIKLTHYISGVMKSIEETSSSAKEFTNIELVKPESAGELAIIKCWHQTEANAAFYLGHWNDGVI